MKIFTVGDPSAVTGRAWAIGLDPPTLHARACEVFSWRKTTRITGVKVLDSSISVDPSVPFFPAVCSVLDQVRRLGHPLPLQKALELLERLTIALSFRIILPGPSSLPQPDASKSADSVLALDIRVDRALSAKDLRLSDLVPGDTFPDRWGKWCFESGRPLELLAEYEFLTEQLGLLTEDGTRLWTILRRRVGATGRLNLESWFCNLARGWQARCDPDWPASQWAEFLISVRHGTHTRDVKEQLRDARLERQIRGAWAAYGRWLLDHPDALHEVEVLLGMSIMMTREGDEFLSPEESPKIVTTEKQ